MENEDMETKGVVSHKKCELVVLVLHRFLHMRRTFLQFYGCETAVEALDLVCFTCVLFAT